MSWWTDHCLLCPSRINLSGDPWPPVTPPFTHTLFLPHPSTTWIMHHQTVGSELMSQLLREPGETLHWAVMVIPSRPFTQVVLTTRCPRCGVMNYGSSLSPLFCSVTTLGGKSMWSGPCGYMHVCVCFVFAQGWRTFIYVFWLGKVGIIWLWCFDVDMGEKQLWYNKDYTICHWTCKGWEYMYETRLWKQI